MGDRASDLPRAARALTLAARALERAAAARDLTLAQFRVLALIAAGVWRGAGVLGPEAFDAVPFLERMRERGEAWHVDDR